MPQRNRALLLLLLASLLLTGALISSNHAAAQSSPKLRVATKSLPPFVIVAEDGSLSGFSIDLWQALAAELELDYEWVVVETVTQQIESVQNGAAQAAISGISMTPQRERIIDFSHPFFEAGLQIMTQQYASLSLARYLAIIFSPAILRIFGVGLLILLVMAHLIWLVERNSNEAMPRAYLPGIWEAVWWSIDTIATLEYGDGLKPRSPLKRLFAMTWVVFGIILIAQFTAAITASLTMEQISGAIRGPGDLPGNQIATVAGSTAEIYLQEHDLDYTSVARIDEAYPLLEHGEVDAIVFDSPVLLYHTLTKGKGSLQVVGPIFQDESYAIALPTGSTLREPINNALLDLKQSGVYQQLYQKWFGEK